MHKIELKIDYYESDILRNAYELILENSQLFYEELANAFITLSRIVQSPKS